MSEIWLTHRRRVGFLIIVGLSIAGFTSTVLGDSSKPTCWKGQVPDGVNPCSLFEHARRLQDSLTRPANHYAKELADGLDIERSLRVQEGLLREHLAWQNDQLTARQIDLLVFVSVAVSLERAEERTAELDRELAENNDPDVKRRLESVELYSVQAWTLLGDLSFSLKNLRKSDLEFGL